MIYSFSIITNIIKPEMFAVLQLHILAYGLLLAVIFVPIEFSIFYMFEAQKADIIGALMNFPYMGLLALLYRYLMKSSLIICVIIIAIMTNIIFLSQSQ